MWVKFEDISSKDDVICVASNWGITTKDTIQVAFGAKSIFPKLEYREELELFRENTFENPGIIMISSALRDKLLLPKGLTYRVKIMDASIGIGPLIGFLMGMDTARYSPTHMMKYSDRFGIYSLVGGLIYAFSPKHINWEKETSFGLYYNVEEEKWIHGNFPLPEVIYRRDFHSNPEDIKKLQEFTNGNLFNSYRFSKYELYNFVKMSKELYPYLPPTELTVDFAQIRNFLTQYQKIIMKPIDLSRGRGILFIEKIEGNYKISDYRGREETTYWMENEDDLESFFDANKSLFQKYLVQKYLNLAKVEDSFFDIRVVMHKELLSVDKDWSWKCTGIECRVACPNCYLTNISKGGYPLTLEEAIERSFGLGQEGLCEKVRTFSQNLCMHLDKMGEHYAEFGIDIAVDKNKKLWLIEVNVFPSFKGFKRMNMSTYLSIRYEPLLYALSLSKFSKEALEEKNWNSLEEGSHRVFEEGENE